MHIDTQRSLSRQNNQTTEPAIQSAVTEARVIEKTQAPRRHIRPECISISERLRSGNFPSFARDHIVHWARHPDAGSAFARYAYLLKGMPASVVIPALRFFRYDGLLLLRDESVIGHLFFQRHGDKLHMFSWWIAPEHREQGLGTKLIHTFVECSRKQREIHGVRLGGGKNEETERVVSDLRRCAPVVGLFVDRRSYVSFTDRLPRLYDLRAPESGQL